MSAAIERREPSGKPDPSFGEGGAVTVPAVDGLALQSDGRILYGVDKSPAGCRPSSNLHRLEPDGEPDTGFGQEGASATLPFAVERIAEQPDGKIVVAGRGNYGPCGRDLTPYDQLALARLEPDGVLDPGFGEGGIIETHTDDGLDETGANDLALAEDGDILVAGSSSLLRFAPDGALDPSFGGSGQVRPPGLPGELVMLPGGGLLLAGPSAAASTCCRSNSSDFLLSRYLPDGRLDPSFGAGGTATLGLSQVDAPTALALDPDGTILLAGTTSNFDGCPRHCELESVIARFTANGELDPSFGEEGHGFVVPFVPFGPGEHSARVTRIDSLAVEPDGRIPATGGGTETNYVSSRRSRRTAARVPARPAATSGSNIARQPARAKTPACWSNRAARSSSRRPATQANRNAARSSPSSGRTGSRTARSAVAASRKRRPKGRSGSATAMRSSRSSAGTGAKG